MPQRKIGTLSCIKQKWNIGIFWNSLFRNLHRTYEERTVFLRVQKCAVFGGQQDANKTGVEGNTI
jgi:hypothetical protein